MSEQHLPNLFLVGAMKCGTTLLYQILRDHPDIFMSARKELNFFAALPGQELSRARYLEFFAEGKSHRYRGEASTHYTKYPSRPMVAGNIFRFNPHARILYLVRDPYERICSHYWHDVGRNYETRGVEKAIVPNSPYFHFSDYGRQIRPYVELFGEDRVRILVLEELLRSPRETLSALWKWLGVADWEVPASLPVVTPTPPQVWAARVPGLGYLDSKRRIRMFFNKRRNSLGIWGELSRRAIFRKIEVQKTLPAELRATVMAELGPMIEEFSKLTGRAYPEWGSVRELCGEGSNLAAESPARELSGNA